MEVNNEARYHANEYVLEGFNFSSGTLSFILAHCAEKPDTSISHFYDIQPEFIEINSGIFSNPYSKTNFPKVTVQYKESRMVLNCECKTPKRKLCDHQAQVLYNVTERTELRIFFDVSLRNGKIKETATEYGLENETGLNKYFQLRYEDRVLKITPVMENLLRVNEAGNKYLSEQLLPLEQSPLAKHDSNTLSNKTVLVFSQHKYYKHLQVDLYEAETNKAGKLKSLVHTIDPLSLVWRATDLEASKFYTAISAFQNNYSKNLSAADIQALVNIVRNPVSLEVFYHNKDASINILPQSLVPVQLHNPGMDCRLHVRQADNFYELSGQLMMNDKLYPMKKLLIRDGYFIQLSGAFYLMDDLDMIRVINFFSKHHSAIIIHASKFEEFRKNILGKLENKILISYAWVAPANKEQLEETSFDQAIEKIIYLSDAGNQISITPVMRYGEIEIPVLSKKQLYGIDRNGKQFLLERNSEAEIEFTALLLKQHPDFGEQLHMGYFYLTKNDFLEESWFLEAFDVWQKNGVTVFGFDEVNKKRLNPHKAKVNIKVNSGLDWFDTDIDVRFGKQKATLRQLQKSIKHRSKFVQLDDGTQGIIPAEWILKFADYFQMGEVQEDIIRTARINFSGINEMYEPEMLSDAVKKQLELYHSKLHNFESIQPVNVPADLHAQLRTYQHEGLNWLNFLDDFGFGGCLADDMGLGKTIQVIAFMLLLRNKHGHQTHLVAVPTSIIFNWQDEVEKFAPSLKILTLHGNNRVKNNNEFKLYDIILTSYGTLIADIHFLKTFHFNYIFLDESQAIKNPDSQRYKTACMLRSNNKIVLTGTPIENNSFDLFGQFSFACPGLLGNKQYFRDIYSIPIDKFSDSKRAIELQKKIHPFILRRTKRQVATELPDKTEMIIYCEMGTEQRKVYDAYEHEFRNYLLHKREEDLSQDSMNVLQGLTKLRQICDSPVLLKDNVFYGDTSSKIEVLMEQIESKYNQHKVLVFSQFVSMLELIKSKLVQKNIPFELLTGQTKNRGEVVNTFQNDESVRVFLVSLKAGGTGLNLTEADYVYLVDPWWNPAAENQAIDRSYRIGQKKNVVAVRLICPDTIEEKIVKLQASKNELIGDLVKTDKLALKNLSKTDLLALVTQ